MPTPYVKQTWIDGVAGATPISAARLSHMEDGIENATVEDGTYAEPPVAGDKIIYVGRGASASDANNGLSAGKAKATLAAACAALPTGGVVQMLAGTFDLTFTAHPGDPAYQVGAVVFPNTIVRGFGDVTTVRLADNQPDGYCFLNRNMGGGDDGIVFEDFILDGNNVNQGAVTHHGIVTIRARNCHRRRVKAKNLKGTTALGSTENFFFDDQLGADHSYVDCWAYRDAGSSSSGFSSNGCSNASWTNCWAWGMDVANGFTHNSCVGLTYVNCRAWLNAEHGMNSEISDRVQIIGGIYGGQALVSAGTPYPYTTGQDLGNTGQGVVCNGSTNMELIGVDSSHNTGAGLFAQNGGTGRILGGNYSDNGQYGITLLDTQAVSPWHISGKPRVVSNAVGVAAIGGIGASGVSGLVTAPDVPASTVAITNPFPFDCSVYISGGAVNFVSLDGANTGLAYYHFLVRAGGTIAINYGTVPTWVWFTAAGA